MPAGPPDSIAIAPYRPEHAQGVLVLLTATLGWDTDPRHARLFRWKHHDNPFGPSPAWVALDAGRVVAFRAFMRWEVTHNGASLLAVRAVDTATHPDYQGRGLFRQLTLAGLDELRDQGVAFVFNTPNDQSRPGYLKMGWQLIGRLPVVVRPRSLRAVRRLSSARVPAALWSIPTSAGHDPVEVLSDTDAVERLLATQRPTARLQTAWSARYLSWRYGAGPLGYRAILAGKRLHEGLLLFRLRRRGPLVEAAVGNLIVPAGSPRLARNLVQRALTASRADYSIRLASDGMARSGHLPLPGQGPMLAGRSLTLAALPTLAQWSLTLGDVELF
ncbi:MAG: GNAT family N-acetyltransferase [Anaerolineales bacterium]